jgi:hypothetical protein
MSAIREAAESAAASTATVNKRCDALLLGEEDLYLRDVWLAHAVQALVAALRSLIEPEDFDRVMERVNSVLSVGEREQGIFDAADRMRNHSEERVAAVLAERDERNRREPWIPVRGTVTRTGHSHPKNVDPDGRIWGNDEGGDWP